MLLVKRIHILQPFPACEAGQGGIGEADIQFRVQNGCFFENATVWHLYAGHFSMGIASSLASCLDKLNSEVSNVHRISAMIIAGTTMDRACRLNMLLVR